MSGTAGFPQARRSAGTLTALAVATLLTAGCAAPPSLPTPQTVSGPVLSGRIAVRVDAARAEDSPHSTSGAFELSGDADLGQLRLVSPLGTVLADARWRPGAGVWLQTGDDRRHFRNLTELSRETLGEDVPLMALMHWLEGRPWPQAPHEPQRQPAGFTQLGWTVDTSALAESGLLVAQRTQPPAVTVRARLDR